MEGYLSSWKADGEISYNNPDQTSNPQLIAQGYLRIFQNGLSTARVKQTTRQGKQHLMQAPPVVRLLSEQALFTDPVSGFKGINPIQDM